MDMRDYLQEDVGFGDLTSNALLGEEEGSAIITTDEELILAGVEEATEIFTMLGLEVEALAQDGDRLPCSAKVLRVRGRLKDILLGERLALNFLMRMSGIATTVSDLNARIQAINPKVRVAATRKTTPGFRFYEKKAVIVGGGDPHRYRLDDALLIKDNHLEIVGSITEAIRRAKAASFTKKVEVETTTQDQAMEAVGAGADIIMLDNMSPENAREAFLMVKQLDQNVVVEVSGGITPETIEAYANAADIISMGWITHSVRSAHLSLDVERE
jgi:nicotinate-nucleotide pyrophosphorylase (carboxylating)